MSATADAIHAKIYDAIVEQLLKQRLRLDRLLQRTVDLRDVLAAGRRAATGQRRGASSGARRPRASNLPSPAP